MSSPDHSEVGCAGPLNADRSVLPTTPVASASKLAISSWSKLKHFTVQRPVWDRFAMRSCLPLLLVALLTFTPLFAMAQQPDVEVKADLVPTYVNGMHEGTQFRFYDVLGHYSTVGLSVSFEQGFHVYASERIERIPDNSDSEQLDEYYVEDPGIWRLGKQYLPFGRQSLLREDARAARGDTRLLFKDVPISVAICDNGNGLAQGAVGRIGSVIGFSFAVGHYFGAEATDFTIVRRPEDSPGRGRGYKAIFGADFARHLGMYTFQIEGAALRAGETALDRTTEVLDTTLTIQPNRYQAVTLGFSRDWASNGNFYRIQGKFLVTRAVWFEPLIRMRDSEFYDLGLTVHVKL